MSKRELLLSAARCWAAAGQHEQAGDRYARAEAWTLAAEAYDRAEHEHEGARWHDIDATI